MLFGEQVEAGVELGAGNIRHRHELDSFVNVEVLARRSGAAPAAADQRDLDLGVRWRGEGARGGGKCRGGGGRNERTTCDHRRVWGLELQKVGNGQWSFLADRFFRDKAESGGPEPIEAGGKL